MPILTGSLQEIRALTGVNHATLRSQRLRGTAVAAFGMIQPLLDSRWLLVDGLAMLIRDNLARSGMPMHGAVMTTRAFWPEWTEALAHVEHRGQAWLFTVAEISDGKWWCARGPATGLPKLIQRMRLEDVPRRLYNVNIPKILLDMQTRAQKAGLDLSGGSVSLPPDHKLLLEWMEEFRRNRKAAQEKFDPLHMKEPPPPSARYRKAIEAAAWAIH
jgi:hypothetical protein